MAYRSTHHWIAPVSGAAATLLGVLVLLGWQVDTALLKGLTPGLPTMKPNTAAGFLFAGVAVLLLCGAGKHQWFRWASGLLGLALIALGSVTLYQDLGGIDLGIDMLLYYGGQSFNEAGALRMAPNVSIGFFLCGLALLLLSLALWYVVSDGLAIVSGFIGLLAVLGYLYNVESFYGFDYYSGMSAHSAVGFLFLSLAILTIRADRGPVAIVVSDTAAGVIMRRLLPIALLLPIVAGYLRLLGQRAGYYGTEYGVALLVISVIIVFVGLIWWNAISVYRAEMGKRRAEGEIVRLNRSLKRRVAELQTVLEVAPVGLAVAHDPECADIAANPAFAAMLGVEPGTNISKSGEDGKKLPFKMMRGGKELAPDQLSMQLAAREERLISGDETEIIRSDGAVVTLLEYAAPVYDEDGKVRGALGAFVDITALKAAQSSLQAQTRALETINRVNTQLAAELDVDKLVQVLTDAGKELSGAEYGAFLYNLTGEAGESRTLYTLAAPNAAARTEFPMANAENFFAPTFHGEGIVRLADIHSDPRFEEGSPPPGLPEGSAMVRSYLAAPVVSRSGQVLGGLFFGHSEPGSFGEQEERLIAGIADQAAIALENAHLYNMARRELADRKKAEHTLRDLNETLEARVAERTAALQRANTRLRAEVSERSRAERALERSNAALRQSNRELQDFAYVASHDLQEPLRKIGSFAGLLKTEYAGGLDETARFYVERMQHAAERMSKLIHDLLSFSRITTKGSAFREIDLNETLKGVLSDLEIKIQEAEAEIEVSDLPKIEADPTQMRQLFQNLITNALKFQSAGRNPRIEISAAPAEREGHRRRHAETRKIFIRDNGIGFDEKYLEKIFSPFQRLHAQAEYPGTGMGLAICRRIVERHNGVITATSTPGEGSTFIIELPVRHLLEEEARAESISA